MAYRPQSALPVIDEDEELEHWRPRSTTSERALDRFGSLNRWRNGRSISVVRFDDGYADACLASLDRTHWGVRYHRLARLRRRLEHWEDAYGRLIPWDRAYESWAGPRS